MSNLETSLKLEILRLKSICRTAAEELESLHDMLEENDINTQKCNKLIAGLKGDIFLDYIKNYPDFEDQQSAILEK